MIVGKVLPYVGLTGTWVTGNGGTQKKEEWNFPDFSRPWLNSKKKNDKKVFHSEPSLFC